VVLSGFAREHIVCAMPKRQVAILHPILTSVYKQRSVSHQTAGICG
jgi:hypothetical protein